VIVILGVTGAGKTRLGIDLAKHFQGEVVSADSIQLYDHLSIASGKVSETDMEGIPHHLVSVVSVRDHPWTVKDFVRNARSAISEIVSRKKLPIIVGGTFYYVEALLWDNLVSKHQVDSEADRDKRSREVEAMRCSGMSLHEQLEHIDPARAARLHPNDKRKVQRSIEVWIQTGKSHSENIAETGGRRGLESVYQPCFLWLDAEKEYLLKKCETRVDSMVEAGVIQEFQDLYRIAPEARLDEGVFQAIGYKEFLPWLTSQLEDDSESKEIIKKECLHRVKLATRKYISKQLQWMRNRFRPSEDILIRINAQKAWSEFVLAPSISICEEFLKTGSVDISKYSYLSKDLETLVSHSTLEFSTFFCDLCQVSLYGRIEYDVHFKSRKHRKRKRDLSQAHLPWRQNLNQRETLNDSKQEEPQTEPVMDSQ